MDKETEEVLSSLKNLRNAAATGLRGTDFFKGFVVASEKTCKANWRGLPPGKGFFCAFCGTPFKVGDEYRAIYTNDIVGAWGNPLCCRSCFDFKDGVEGLRDEWTMRWEEYQRRFKWWAVAAQHAD